MCKITKLLIPKDRTLDTYMTATKTFRQVSPSVERVYDEDKILCATKKKGLDAIMNVFYRCSKIWQTEELCHAFIFNSEVNFVTPPKR